MSLDRRKTHKGQHWLPRSYLRAWTDPSCPDGQQPYIHVVAKDGGSQKKRAPENVFKETDLYTIKSPDGSRDLRLEYGLSDLEDAFARMRRDFLEERRLLPPARFAKLLLFVAAMHARTPRMRDQWLGFWSDVKEQGDRMTRYSEAKPDAPRLSFVMPPSDSERSMSMSDVERIVASPMEAFLGPSMEALAPLLLRMQLQILHTDDPVGFITSDVAVVWYDPESHTRPPIYRQPALAYPKTEVTMPVSPTTMLRFLHGTPGHAFIPVGRPVVDELNRRTRFHCREHFVSRSAEVNSFWLWEGTPPPDVWTPPNDEGNACPRRAAGQTEREAANAPGEPSD